LKLRRPCAVLCTVSFVKISLSAKAWSFQSAEVKITLSSTQRCAICEEQQLMTKLSRSIGHIKRGKASMNF